MIFTNVYYANGVVAFRLNGTLLTPSETIVIDSHVYSVAETADIYSTHAGMLVRSIMLKENKNEPKKRL